jgi:hypothetical protein
MKRRVNTEENNDSGDVRVTITISKKILARIKDEAKKDDRSVSSIIRRTLEHAEAA